MKCLCCFTMLASLLFTNPLFAEYFTEVYAGGTTNIIQVPTNKVMSKIIVGRSSISIEKKGVSSKTLYDGFRLEGSLINGTSNAKIAGPATVKFVNSPNWLNDVEYILIPDVVSYEMSDNESVQLSKPSNAVVIPADSIGPIEIVLESSKDLITWTAAEPGIYGATDQKRFFRVRAVAR